MTTVMRTVAGARLADLPQVRRLGRQVQREISIVSTVLPFKVNNHLIDKLIAWSAAPDDPIFRLTFPHREMLPGDIYDEVGALLDEEPRGRTCVAQRKHCAFASTPTRAASLRRTYRQTNAVVSRDCNINTARRC